MTIGASCVALLVLFFLFFLPYVFASLVLSSCLVDAVCVLCFVRFWYDPQHDVLSVCLPVLPVLAVDAAAAAFLSFQCGK